MPEVLCNDEECLHWKKLDEPRDIQYCRNFVPLEGTSYTGICQRDVVGIKPKVITTNIITHNTMVCMTRSEKKNKGHLDFTKLMPQVVDEKSMETINRDKRVNKTRFPT